MTVTSVRAAHAVRWLQRAVLPPFSTLETEPRLTHVCTQATCVQVLEAGNCPSAIAQGTCEISLAPTSGLSIAATHEIATVGDGLSQPQPPCTCAGTGEASGPPQRRAAPGAFACTALDANGQGSSGASPAARSRLIRSISSLTVCTESPIFSLEV